MNQSSKIFILGVDVTDKIAYWVKKGEFFEVKFKNYSKIYRYSSDKVHFENALDALNPIQDYLVACSQFCPIGNDADENLLRRKFVETISKVNKDSVFKFFVNPNSFVPQKVNQQSLLFPFGCNNSQYTAVRNALSNRISIIQGPPGTGKTQTILNILANIILNDKCALVVSQNNNAIFNIKEKLAAKKYGLDFLVATMGKLENVKTFMESQPSYPINMREWNFPNLNKGKISLRCSKLVDYFHNKEKIARLNLELSQLDTEYKYFANSDNSCNSDLLKKISKRPMQEILDLINKIERNGKKKEKICLVDKFRLWLFYGFGNIFFWKLKSNDVFALLKNALYLSKRAEIVDEILFKEAECSKINPNEVYDDSLNFLKNHVLNRFPKNERMKFTSEDWSKKIYDFICEYPIVLSTTFSSRSCIPYHKQKFLYDYVIIDEASQVDIVTGAMALSCARNVVIVGDSKQLPNVVPLDVEQSADIIFDQYSVFEAYRYKNSFLDCVEMLFPNAPKVMLKEHYRCHPKIIEFCNQKFYNNELVVMTKDEGEKNVLEVIKTPIGNHCSDHVNERQIDVIEREVLPSLDSEEIHNIGFVAPYNNQVDAINRRLNVGASTIHKYQGREKDVILLSTTDNRVSNFSDDPHMINVAVSRAKKRLIIVTTGNEIPPNTNLSDLIGYIEYNGFKVMNSNVHSIFDILYTMNNIEKKGFFEDIGKISDYPSENLMYGLLIRILKREEYSNLKVLFEVALKDVLKPDDIQCLSDKERKYALNDWTHIDFAIFNKLTKRLLCAVEVDGYQYHKGGTKQRERDALKNSIFEKCGIVYERFSTKGCCEENRVVDLINRALGVKNEKVMEE